ncbi:HAUS augmin-like complex subunit 4 isoform X2 [Phalacrocorax carbo]|uniref:HAUS augmin-like complex subunit 4 isoform X2 n=1 Tax=Phalacrocorax carbo TaxID=9209 RepID=UPI00311A2360
MALDEELPGLDVLLLEEESALAVSGVTPEELRAYPGLARLLEELGCAPSGGELRQAAWELAQQREAWLRWESLWRGLRELLLETPTHETPALEPAVRRALERSLLLAELRHRAPALASLLPPAEDPSLLRARVLPVLERHLAHKVQEVARYYSGGTAAPQNPSPAPQDPSSAPQDPSSAPPGPPKGVAEALADDQSRLRRARIRSRRLEQLLAQQRGAYSQGRAGGGAGARGRGGVAGAGGAGGVRGAGPHLRGDGGRVRAAAGAAAAPAVGPAAAPRPRARPRPPPRDPAPRPRPPAPVTTP